MNKFEVVSAYADKRINIPTRATRAAAGYDFEVAEDIVVPSAKKLWDEALYYITSPQYVVMNLADIAAFTKEYKVKPTLVPTGIKCQLASDCYLELSVRSSTPLKHWLILANGVGIIDGDYYNNPDNEGHIYFQLINLSPFDIVLKKGDKIGQGIIKKFEVTDDDYKYEKKERAGGFGSTSTAMTVAKGMDPQVAQQLSFEEVYPYAFGTINQSKPYSVSVDITPQPSFDELSKRVKQIQENLYKQLQGTMLHG